MKWLLITGATLVTIVLVVVLVGMRLPVAHVASRSATLRQPPDAIWTVITDVKNYSSWRRDVSAVELLPSSGDGRTRWVEVSGGDRITYQIAEMDPPRRLVVRIADTGLPFGGSWTYDLAPATDGTRLTITEHGEVYNPVFRFMSRFVFGHSATIEKYLSALAGRFGETALAEGARGG